MWVWRGLKSRFCGFRMTKLHATLTNRVRNDGYLQKRQSLEARGRENSIIECLTFTFMVVMCCLPREALKPVPDRRSLEGLAKSESWSKRLQTWAVYIKFL
jgi:hypothetical protein